MIQKKVIIPVVLVLGLIIAFIVWKWVFRLSETDVSSKKPDVEISAPDLLAQFETDESSANEKFLGKIILVSGLIDAITEDSTGYSIYLKQKEDISGIICVFNKSVFEQNQLGVTGKEVNIKGECTGYLMDVVLNKCSFQ